MSKIKSALEMVNEANAQIENIDVDQAHALMNDENVMFVDIRDIRELWREGTIPKALSAPRGMLEFWMDPSCKYHKKEFSQSKKLIFFCASAWRSALAVKGLQDMGFDNIAHLSGGFSAWKSAGFEIQKVESKKK